MHLRTTLGPALLIALLATACATPLTPAQLDARIEEAAGPPPAGQTQRVQAIHADTKIVAWALLDQARSNPRAGIAGRLTALFARCKARGERVVVGGLDAGLVDGIVALALAQHPDGALEGLDLVLVSPAAPGPDLVAALRASGARLLYRPL